MRRFEKGNRFWEISLDGRSVATCSGSLRGKGRHSSKRYASARAAMEEIDKRVAKRMAEPGWIEVLPPFQGSADLQPRVDGLDPDRVARWQRRPGTLEVDGPGAAKAVTKRLRMARERFAKGLEAGARLADAEAQDAVVRILQKGPAFLTDGLTARSVLLAMAPEAETAELLVARFGIVATVEAVAKGPRFAVQRDLRTARLEPGDPSQAKVRPAVACLRDLLAQASEADHAACEALAKDALGDGAHRDLELVTLFPATDWTDAFLLGSGLTAETMLAAGCASPEAFVRLVHDRPATRFTTAQRLLPQLEILMQRHGAAAAPAVMALAEELGAEGVPLMARVRTPDTVDHLVQLLGDARRGTAARAALIGMSDLTLATLASKPRLGKAAAELAQELALQPGLATALHPHLDERTAARLRTWVGDDDDLPVADSMPALLTDLGGRPLEPWIRLPALPPLRTPDGRLAYPPSALASALQQLSEDHGPLDEGQADPAEAIADALAEVCDPTSLDAVLADVLTAWSDGVAESLYGRSPWSLVREERDDDWDEVAAQSRWVRDPKAPDELRRPWVIHAVHLLGGEACGRALFQCILAWGRKGGRYPELLSDAIDVLCGVPGDETLVHLGALARRVPKAKVRIELFLKRVARERGIDPRHLDEMLLPTLGLDERGRKELDFGPRTFVVGFDPSLDPVVHDADGKVRKTLPRPTKSDDKAMAKAATAEWKELKKQVRALRTTLMGRLEAGMRSQRSWHGSHFLTYLARHPLARHPVSALVWSVADTTFRVDESGQPVDIDDEPVALDGLIRLVHPLQLAPDDRDAWREVLSDYELIQPFEQLDRSTYGTAGVRGLRGERIPRGRLFALRNRGWVWQSSSKHGEVVYAKPMLQAMALTLQGAKVSLTAAEPVDVKEDDGLTIGRVELFTGDWQALPPVAMSEIARDLRRAVEWE